MPSLKGFQVSPPQQYNIADFVEDDENVNAHSDIDLNATFKSMEKFGQVENLIVNIRTKKVLGGNGRFRKMKEAGWKTFWAVAVEGTDDQLKTLAIALNKTGRLSDFDYTKLAVTLQELQYVEGDLLALTGFQQHELEPLLASEMHLPDVEVEAEKQTKQQEQKPEKDLDQRGMTLQFSTQQLPVINESINKVRGQEGNFSLSPAECLHIIAKRYIMEDEENE